MNQTPENVSQAIRELSEEFHLMPSSAAFQPTVPAAPKRKTGERRHIYRNADGSIFGKKVIIMLSDGRKLPRWYHYDPKTKTYSKGLKGQKAPLYNAHILHNMDEETVFITEGEKDADTMSKLDDIPATTIPNGAGFTQWLDLYNDGLQGKDIIILTDNDDAGRKYGSTVARNVVSIANSVKIIPASAIWEKCPEKGDISDIVRSPRRRTAQELLTEAVRRAEFLYAGTRRTEAASSFLIRKISLSSQKRAMNLKKEHPVYLVSLYSSR